MIILCQDTSNKTCCAGVYKDSEELSYEISFDKRTHSETFMPLCMRVLQKAGLNFGDLDALAVTIGPGSFTGIRIGLASVKGMAAATGLYVIPVSSLKALALSVESVISKPEDTLIVPCFDARNDRVFAGVYQGHDGEPLVFDNAFYNEDFIKLLSDIPGVFDKQIIVTGDGADILRKVMPGSIRADYAPGAVIVPKGIMRACEGISPVNAALVKASYCAASRARKYGER